MRRVLAGLVLSALAWAVVLPEAGGSGYGYIPSGGGLGGSGGGSAVVDTLPPCDTTAVFIHKYSGRRYTYNTDLEKWSTDGYDITFHEVGTGITGALLFQNLTTSTAYGYYERGTIRIMEVHGTASGQAVGSPNCTTLVRNGPGLVLRTMWGEGPGNTGGLKNRWRETGGGDGIFYSASPAPEVTDGYLNVELKEPVADLNSPDDPVVRLTVVHLIAKTPCI